ncbi:ABC transporter ATP-binding protein [[Clostridium] fimetarium]|uniref:ABC-type multidrug transport system, ATPase and permease component n=1 Tax=[Clostridium] fimetarium TaxID=99656 RepID=A0A1I0NM54_9FIRM|nr:ABC transporter ATP-binding protein [[Clostridium] fimetarium]SEW02527.1 ABC-type multidrug transport system, ATPase and permease component [[Clostridium] fimetarium]
MNLRKTFVRFMKLLDKKLYLYSFVIIIMTISGALFYVISAYLLKGVLEIAQSKDTSGLARLITLNVIAGFISLLICWAGTIIYNIEGKRGTAVVQKLVFSKAMKLPMSYYENHHSGDFISKLLYDTNTATDIYRSRLRRLVAPIIIVIVYLIPMFTLSWQVTLCLLGVNIISLICNSIFVKPMKNIGSDLSKKNSAMTERLSNLLQGIEMTKIFSAGKQIVEKYEEANNNFATSQKKKNIFSACLEGINAGFDLICSLAFLGVGIFYVEKGVTTIGSLTAIYAMYGAFSWQFLQIGRYIPELVNCISIAGRVFEFLDEEEEADAYNITGASGKEYIEFEDITFGYTEDRKILDHFSLSVKKGTSVAITGTSGRGKSTLAKILLGFYEPEEGRISIGGKSMQELGLKNLRDMIAYVPQEPYIYNVSIKENIAYGNMKATDDEIILAAKAANAHEFIEKQENGYDTIPGERGGKLSGGERQRIAIARAVLKNAPILLLDEATSALDNESERLVQEALDNLMKDRTTIMIAHRPSTIASADVSVAM